MAEVSDIQKVLIGGNLGKLTTGQKEEYYVNLCESLGLNPLTRPFDWIEFQGKLNLYAKRDATDQLRKIHSISIKLTKEKLDDLFVVTAQAAMPSGRQDESLGAIMIANLKGEGLANAIMKTETKAKRRVTLSICGLGMLDETEVEDVNPDAPPAKFFGEPPRKAAEAGTGAGLAMAAPTPEPKADKRTDFPFGANEPPTPLEIPTLGPLGPSQSAPEPSGVPNTPPAQPEAVKTPTKLKTITKAQQARLFAILGKSQRTSDDLKTFLKTVSNSDHPDGIEHTSDIPANVYELVVGYVQGGSK